MKKIFYIILAILILVSVRYVYRNYIQVRDCPQCKQHGNKAYYSQMEEDYILSILFADQDKGFYIDVGASHPEKLSVTKFFYNKGWHGINIEPIKEMFDKIEEARPLDKNYNVGASDFSGSMEFSETNEEGVLSSFEDISDYANISKKYTVTVKTLTEILDENNPKEIDFLKIDVEEHEKRVLLGMDFKKYRPKVLLLEAISHDTHEPLHQNWEYILDNAGYVFVYTDGLNRFYIDKNQSELLKRFKKVKQCLRVCHS